MRSRSVEKRLANSHVTDWAIISATCECSVCGAAGAGD